MDDLIYIICNYLLNKKNKIEVQRLNLKYLHKFDLSQNELEILLDKEKLFEFMVKNNLLQINENPNTHDKKYCLCCGKPTKFLYIYKGYRKYCSRECAAKFTMNIEKCKQTKLEKYNDEYYNNFNKAKQTKLERYNDEYFTNPDKIKNTWNSKTNIQKGEIVEKRKNTNLEKFGVDHPCKIEEIKQKIRNTFFTKYGYYWNFSIPEIIEQKKIKQYNTNVKNKRWFNIEEHKLFKLYFKRVWSITKKEAKHIVNIKKRSVDYHLDHIFSIKEGFVNNIPPYIIGSRYNLRIIPAAQNCKKNSKSDISKEQLFNIYFTAS